MLWGAWHLPLFLTPEWGGWPDVAWCEPLEFIAAGVPLSVVMTWVLNRTRESLPIVMVLHATSNAFGMTMRWDLFPGLAAQGHVIVRVMLIGYTIVAAMLLVVTRGRLGLPDRHDVEDAPAGRAAP